MAAWSWTAYDLATGVKLGDIEMSQWSHTDTLDDSGSFTATMTGRSAAVRRDYLGVTTIGKTVIVAVRDGMPLFAGIVWGRNPPHLAGAGLLSYFDRRRLYTTKQYLTPGTDQHTVVKELVDWVQANGGNIQVDTSQVTASGVLRIQTWNIWELKNVGEAIRQKGDNLGGFDFDIRVEYDTGVLTRRLRLWTPRRGRIYLDTQSSPTFELDGRRGNLLSPPAIPTDGQAMVTDVFALGQEINSTTHEHIVARSTRIDVRAAGWPQLDHVLDLPDVKEVPTLQAHADGYAYSHGAVATDEVTFQLAPDHEPWSWGTWDLGDDGLVSIPPGDVVPWMPDGFAEVRRVTQHQWDWSSKDGESLQVTTGKRLGT